MSVIGRRTGAVNRILLLSDGEANAGIRDAEGFFGLAERARGMDTTVSSIGVDIDYNEQLMLAVAQGSNGRHYFVMELLRGPTLSARLKQGALAIDDALRIASDLLQGLGAAHGRGILHRDIKPGNVKLVDDGRAVIMDFGMARASESVVALPARQLRSAAAELGIEAQVLPSGEGAVGGDILGQEGEAALGGQWRRGRTWPFELEIVSNAANPEIPATSTLQPIA